MSDSEDAWGQFSPAARSDAGEFRKGDAVFYVSRDGAWLPSEVVSVDKSVAPPSFCIAVGSSLRETEGWRLRRLDDAAAAQVPGAWSAQEADAPAPASPQSMTPLPPPPPPPPATLAALADAEEDDFGDFCEVTSSTPAPVTPGEFEGFWTPEGASSQHASPRSPRAAPEGGTPASASPRRDAPAALQKFQSFLRVTVPPAARKLDETSPASAAEISPPSPAIDRCARRSRHWQLRALLAMPCLPCRQC